MNRWLSRYLYGVENGVESDPGAWIVREGDDRLSPTPYPSYPNPDAESVRVVPSGDGGRQGCSRLEADPAAAQQSFTDDVSFSGADLAGAEASEHRLLFATPNSPKKCICPASSASRSASRPTAPPPTSPYGWCRSPGPRAPPSTTT